MKYFAVAALLILSSAAFYSVDAAIGRADFSNPTYPGKCVFDANTIMSPGQTGKAPNHPCAGVTCLENGHAVFKTCDAVAPPKGCKQRDFANTNRPFPSCCERTYDCTKLI